jgi:hypothetical protein
MATQTTQKFADDIIKEISNVLHFAKNKKKQFRRELISILSQEISESAVPSPFHCVVSVMMDLEFDDDTLDQVVPHIKHVCKDFVLENLIQTLFDIMVVCDVEENGEFTEGDIQERISIGATYNFSPETIGMYCCNELRDLCKEIKDFNTYQFKKLIEVDLVNSIRCEICEEEETEIYEETEEEETEEEELEDILNNLDEFCEFSDEEELDHLYGQIELKDKEIELLKKETEIWKMQLSMVTKELGITKKELIDLHEEIELDQEVNIFNMYRGEYTPLSFYGIMGIATYLMYTMLTRVDLSLAPERIDFTLN